MENYHFRGDSGLTEYMRSESTALIQGQEGQRLRRKAWSEIIGVLRLTVPELEDLIRG